jgi:hypothetical protein
MSRSTWRFCQGDRAAVLTSWIPMGCARLENALACRRAVRKTGPCFPDGEGVASPHDWIGPEPVRHREVNTLVRR